MKNIKIFILVILSFTYFKFKGQERISRVKPSINSNILGKLNSATGWMLNPVGDWISKKNTIPVYLDPEFDVLLNHERNSLGIDNFVYYQLRELIYNDSTYFVLIKKFRSGSYSYPSIEKDWYTFYAYNAYVFNKNELLKFDSLKDSVPSSISINLIDNIYTEMKTDAEAISLFESKIKFDNNNEDKLLIEVATYNNKNLVQFQIYTKYSTYDMFLDNRSPFKHCYFETTLTSFKNFLLL